MNELNSCLDYMKFFEHIMSVFADPLNGVLIVHSEFFSRDTKHRPMHLAVNDLLTEPYHGYLAIATYTF